MNKGPVLGVLIGCDYLEDIRKESFVSNGTRNVKVFKKLKFKFENNNFFLLC